MVTVLSLLGVLVVLFVAAVLSTREGPVMADAPRDAADVALPEGLLTPEDVAGLRFGLAPRGYRMSEVDAVLDRLAGELADRDRRLLLLDATIAGESDVVEAGEEDLPLAEALPREPAPDVPVEPVRDAEPVPDLPPPVEPPVPDLPPVVPAEPLEPLTPASPPWQPAPVDPPPAEPAQPPPTVWLPDGSAGGDPSPPRD